MPEKKQTQAARRLKDIEKCPTGIRGLDESAGGGLPRGRPTLICGGAGSGKTGLSAAFADAACGQELEVIDIYQRPALAKGERSSPRPRWSKRCLLPLRKFIGSMADREDTRGIGPDPEASPEMDL